MKKIAAITMVRHDELFLSLWLRYYSREIGAENLYVILDGEDLEIPDGQGAHFENVPHRVLPVADGDKTRITLINEKARQLLGTYDMVIGCDVDEFLVLDPNAGTSLSQYLSEKKIRVSLSGLGLDVGQNLHTEQAYQPDRKVLEQRRFAVLSTRYTKPVVKVSSAAWGAGFHRIKGHNFHIDKNLYLVHLGCFDYAYMEEKIASSGRLKEGWEKHFNKRIRTIRYVTDRYAADERRMRTARLLQTVFRPPYVWNKPSMFGLHWVVTLPERLKDIL